MKTFLTIPRSTQCGTDRALILVLALILFISGCTGGGAPSLDSSGQAWVEFPYEGSTIPMAPVNIVVYAADSGGISYIHIKVNGQSLPTYAASPMTEDGSSRLVRIDYQWIPPAEGEYLVEAAGVNSAGATGGAGSTRFCVVTCLPGETPLLEEPSPPTETPTPTPAEDLPIITLPPIVSDTPAPTITLTVPPLPNVTVNFFAEPSRVEAGNCSYLRWSVTGTDKVYLDGSRVPALSNLQRCPCETETHTLRVTSPDGTTQDYYARIEVSGSCYVPPSDSTGPSINTPSVFWEGCSIYGQTSIYDDSGVSYAEFWYNLNGGGWVSIPMSNLGGGWQSQYGVETGGFSGNLVYKIRAVDIYNNEAWSSAGSYTFSYCGG